MSHKYLERLNNDEYRVFSLLNGLDEHERILGASAMERLAITDRRYFYQLVQNLRDKGLPVISSKNNANSGYKLAKTIEEFNIYIAEREREHRTHQHTTNAMKQAAKEIFEEGA